MAQVETRRHIAFSGEECYGKYLDLHELYNKYTSTKFGLRYIDSWSLGSLSYVDYLTTFPGIDNDEMIPGKYKTTLEYSCYIKDVLEYLISFMKRSRPLTFLDTIFKDLEGKDQQQQQRVKEKVLVLVVEAKVRRLCDILRDTLEHTREYVGNKVMLNLNLDFEVDGKIIDDNDDDDDDDDEKLLNKPIPYWLYKLHGLNHEFKCEICGYDYTYRGRRAFETHFSEERHQHGMGCLGIPNTKSFHEITSIQDAVNLWQHIQSKQVSTQWCPEVDEEFEDADGNVYDKKTFTYLANKGLI